MTEIPSEGRRRVVVERVTPSVDDGRFPAKRTVGEVVAVEADCFTDGHDAVACRLLHRREEESRWREVPMRPLGNDRWRAELAVPELGIYRFTVEAWVDPFLSWRRDLAKRVAAGQDVAVDLAIGAGIVRQAAERAPAGDRKVLAGLAATLAGDGDPAGRLALALDDELAQLMDRRPDRSLATRFDRELEIWVDRERAAVGAWYELFPRSTSPEPGRHGTLRDVEARLDDLAALGFDVLYLPPIHPIGRTHRKGTNNATTAGPGDVGSPWAIGGPEGGHKAIHPALGTLEDFRRLVAAAAERDIEIALDIAFQCSPDHPWVHQHPEWFRKRPDGTIQYAENPPKKYEDIIPFDFECADWRALWQELRSVFTFWREQGVRIFRVDNPHTKPFPFWEWLLASLRREDPELVFLAEAFTRPRVMERLAKIGFNQSYNYFPWRNTKWELTDYLTELTTTELVEYFRPNLWPNTPDILTEHLQFGGRAAFVTRFVLAATLGASYGIYGPAFELLENRPLKPGSEEYLDSEKYQIRDWDLERRGTFGEIIARVNRARRANPALAQLRRLAFHPTDNEQLIAYSKSTPDLSNVILVVANLDPHHTQSGWVSLDLGRLGLTADAPFQVHDLLTDLRFLWSGERNFVELDPTALPVHLFRVRRKVRTEEDFDYFR